MAKKWVRLIAPSVVVIGGSLLVLCSSFPGLMSYDSIDQLTQARADAFSDWHPPVMSWIWGRLDRVWPGPSLMVLISSLMFWLGLVMVALLSVRRRVVALASAIGIGLFPPIFALLGVVWKDVAMGASLLLAFAILLVFRRRGSGLILGAAVLCLFYGLSNRHNALPAVLPLVLWAGGMVSDRFFGKEVAAWRKGLVGLTALGILVATDSWIVRSLTQGKSQFPVQQILFQDLVAVSVEVHRNLLPLKLQPAGGPLSHEELTRLYSREEVVPLFNQPEPYRKLSMVSSREGLRELAAAWFDVIPSHLREYAIHRLRVFGAQLGIHRPSVCLPFQSQILPNSLGIQMSSTALNRQVMGALGTVQDSFLFRGWFYLLLSVILLVLTALRHGLGRIEAWVLGVSGFLYIAPYFFVSTTCDFRMQWWTVVVDLVMPLLIFGEALTRAKSPVDPKALRSSSAG